MAKNTNISATGQAIVGPGRLLSLVVCAHTSGTLKLNDAPNSAVGRVVLDTYTFATGSQVIDLKGLEYYEGLFATVGGTAVSLELVTTPDMGGVIQ